VRQWPLRWDRVDLLAQRLLIERQLLGGLKTKASTRTVDMADPLRDVLRDLQARRRQEAFKAGAPVSPWVLFPDLPEQPDAKDEQGVVKAISRAMARVLKVAGLPPWHTPHSLRHTFGSLLIAAGVSPVYVQQQMGHASITMTVDTYGSWLPRSDVGALNRVFGTPTPDLGPVVGSKVVANGVSDVAGSR